VLRRLHLAAPWAAAYAKNALRRADELKRNLISVQRDAGMYILESVLRDGRRKALDLSMGSIAYSWVRYRGIRDLYYLEY